MKSTEAFNKAESALDGFMWLAGLAIGIWAFAVIASLPTQRYSVGYDPAMLTVLLYTAAGFLSLMPVYAAKMVIRAVRLRQIELEQETTQQPARADRMRFDETLD